METTSGLDSVLEFLAKNLDLAELLGADYSGAGPVLLSLGLALCFAGYLLFRLFLAFLGAATLGGAAAAILLLLKGGESPGQEVLVAGAGGAVLGFALSWFLYRSIVFLSGALVGTFLGIVLLLFSGGTLGGSHPVVLAVVGGVPAVAFGVLYLKEEQVIITVTAALLGALFIAMGMRTLNLGSGEIAASAATAAFGLAMLLHFTQRPQPASVPRQRRRSAPSRPAPSVARRR